MSERIFIRDEQHEDQDGGIILPTPTAYGQFFRLSRRLRTSHYWDFQRASADRLPLIPTPQPATSPFLPPRPPPIYRPQPHQLIAVCFNHMAGRQCDHCQQLNKEYGDKERSERSPDSEYAVGQQQFQQRKNSSRSDSEQEEKPGDGGEKGGGPPPPTGFWDSRLSNLRLEVFGGWARTTLMLCVFILSVLSLYWGVLFNVQQNLSSLNVFVVDCDGTQAPYTDVTPLIGPMITQTTEKMISSGQSGNHLGFMTMDPAEFNNDPMQVRRAVYDFKAWAAIVINPNATALLQQAVQQGNASYDPRGACQQIWVEARDQDTHYAYILPQLSALETEITSMFGEMWTRMVLENTSIPLPNLQAAPQALSPAIGFSKYSLRPFTPPVTTPAVTIGLIYLIILAFFSFTFFLPIYSKFITPSPSPSGTPTLQFRKFILVRWCGTVAAYFFMSLFYSLISLAFQIPFASTGAYARGTFPVYWMINFIGMIALGLACENVAMVVGQPWTAMWLIFWVITNVSTSFYSLDLSPKWYYWGYAWPLHNIVEASRSTLFDLHSRVGLNVGVLLVWCVIDTALFPFCCVFMRRKIERAKKQGK